MQQVHPQPGTEGVLVGHRVTGFSERWEIGDYKVPEAAWHDRALELLKALLMHWVSRTGRDAAVYRDLAVRPLRERPRAGIDPDLMIVEPAPQGAYELSSLRLWEPGHAVPAFALEVVSPGHPWKDYVEIPDQCAALGVKELVVFDPMMAGPKAHGGPRRIQVWRRTDGGMFERVESGEGPFFSAFLGAYLISTDGGRVLRISDDEHGQAPWLTGEEAERAGKEAERAGKEAERAAKERALTRIAELEAELRKRDAK
jgi:Uma2 family endonuclease